jgi:hypothetical protein
LGAGAAASGAGLAGAGAGFGWANAVNGQMQPIAVSAARRLRMDRLYHRRPSPENPHCHNEVGTLVKLEETARVCGRYTRT